MEFDYFGKTIQLDPLTRTYAGSFQPASDGGMRIEEEKIIQGLLSVAERMQVFVDVGANTGSFTLLGVLFPRLKIIGFEPNKMVFDILKHNCELNGVNAELYNMGLGETDTELPLYMSPGGHAFIGETFVNSGISSFHPWKFEEGSGLETQTQPALIKRLDDFNLSPDFIKIDTEGYEEEVIMGGLDTIRRCRPTILFEEHPQFPTKKRHHGALQALQYTLCSFPESDRDILALPGRPPER